MQRALGDVEAGVGASVVRVVDQLHLEALGGAMDRSDGARGAEGHPALLDGGAVAHDLLLRVASICVLPTLRQSRSRVTTSRQSLRAGVTEGRETRPQHREQAIEARIDVIRK